MRSAETVPVIEGGEAAVRSLASRAAWAKRILVVIVAVDLVAVLSGGAEYSLLQRAELGGVSDAEFNANDRRQQLIGATQIGLLVLGALFFLRWFHRAYKNLGTLGAGALRYSTGWAIGSWFIPILNLFRPKQIANDIWRASEPGAQESGWWSQARVPALVHLWWGLFLISGFLGRAALSASGNPETIGAAQTATGLTIATDLTSVAAGVLAILYIVRVTERQRARAQVSRV